VWSESSSAVRIRLAARAQLSLGDRDAVTFSHPLVRRMTCLQKALLETCAQLRKNDAELFQAAVVEAGCPVVFASAMGELESNLAMLTSVLRRELPVSPTAFQHSVHNCPAGYFSIAFSLRNPMVTLCGGFLSADKALLLAASELAQSCEGDEMDDVNGMQSASFALVLVADETGSGAGDAAIPASGPSGSRPLRARAEAILLQRHVEEKSTPLPTGTYLQRCAFPTLPASIEERERLAGGVRHEEPACGVPTWPSLLEDVPRARTVTSASGDCVETLWTVRT